MSESDATSIYRREAVERHNEGDPLLGDILRSSPRWIDATYWLVLGACVAALTFATLGVIDEYASGPAIVFITDKTQIVARVSGLVERIETKPGERVHAGTILARLRSDTESAALERIELEFEHQLARSLLDRTDRVPREALVSLQAQRRQAEATLAERIVRAPQPGVVSDIRIHQDQHLQVGDLLFTLVAEKPRFHVMAFLPGSFRPELRLGMPLRLKIEGHPDASLSLSIDSIGEQVVGPTEVRRFLGPVVGDAVPLSGAYVFISAQLEATTFGVDTRRLDLHDGLQGTAEVPIRRSSVLLMLFPWLRGRA